MCETVGKRKGFGCSLCDNTHTTGSDTFRAEKKSRWRTEGRRKNKKNQGNMSCEDTKIEKRGRTALFVLYG